MRTSTLVTISLPPEMLLASGKVAKKQHMTRSELHRTALRRYLEELELEEALKIYEKEKREGKLKILKGSLVDLMN